MSDVLMELLLLLLAVRILLCYGVQIGVVNLRLRPENNVKISGEFFFLHLKCLNICTGSSSLFCYHQILVRFVIIKRNVVSPSTVIVVLKTLHYENFTNFDKVWQNLATISHLTKAINYNSIGTQHFSRVSVSVSDPVRFKTAGIRIQRYGSITLALKYILLCFSFVLAISLLGR